MAAKRIGREPSPTDLGYKIIQEAVEVLAGLRDIADTDEFRTIANALASISVYDGTPAFDLASKRWSFSTYMTGLQDWQDTRLFDLLTVLKGLDPDAEEHKDYPDSNNKDWLLDWKYEGEFSIRVNVCAYLDAKSPGACRRVKVGTKWVEQDVYRNECAPPAELAPDEALPAPIIQIEAL